MDTKLKYFIIHTLRRASYRHGPRNEALKAAKIARNQYKCAICGIVRKKKEIVIDHRLPIVPITGWDNWEGYIERLFCPKEGFQVICKVPCHKDKSNWENQQRRENKKKSS